MNNELYHYGVKGMKWGQRKAIRQEYRDTKRKINAKYNKAYGNYKTALSKNENDYLYGGKSSGHKAMGDINAGKRHNAAYSKYTRDRAAAKRDYKIAKGKNADRANKKYNNTITRAKRNQALNDQEVINGVYRKHPVAVRQLAKSGKIKTSELNIARIDAGFEVANALLKK